MSSEREHVSAFCNKISINYNENYTYQIYKYIIFINNTNFQKFKR